MPYVFGVDGGGTRSRAILMTDRGRVVYYGKGPGLNYHDTGASQVTALIQRLFQEALHAARGRPEECLGICLGLAGVGQEQDHEILRPLFDNLFGKESYLLTSDAEIALVSGTLSEFGIVVLAGTGSIIFGRNPKGKESRVGGYGPLLSDEGSGYRIGLEALRAIVRYHDGLGPDTPIRSAVLSHLQMTQISEMVNWVNTRSATREKIAALAPIVVRLASEDDPVADEILNQKADALALGVESVCKRLEFSERVDVVLGGGVFNEASYYGQIVRRKILYLLPGANVTPPRFEPVVGAALYALSMAGIPVDEDILDNVRRSTRDSTPVSTAGPAVPTETAPKATVSTSEGEE
ncbi:MAG TPA: BadF/BadG/BcrA/BcrD ATPase family protein [bacterium]|nr:BadF/BadG/BcrA/BcrD ATPase family protein [bacterium]